MKRQLHPLVTLLIGAVFGGLLGAWIAWGLARAPTQDTAIWGGVIGGAVMAGIFGMAHGGHWIYHNVPTVRTYTKGAFGLGAVVGFSWSIIAGLVSLFTGPGGTNVRARSDAYLVGALFGAVGFLLGCLVAVGRGILKRRGRPGPPVDDRPLPPG